MNSVCADLGSVSLAEKKGDTNELFACLQLIPAGKLSSCSKVVCFQYQNTLIHTYCFFLYS